MLGPVSLRLAIFASGAGSTAQAVIDACGGGRIDAEVVLVLSNNADAPVLGRAAAAGIPTVHLSRRTHPDPDALDAALLDAVRSAGATHVLLAGYMRKLGPAMLGAYAGRIYNTHPALLPAYGGEGMYGDRVHAAVLADRNALTGATVHLVTADYDAGPIVRAVEVPVLPDDDVAALGERVRDAERELVVAVLAELARDLAAGRALTPAAASPRTAAGTPPAAGSSPAAASSG
jgi:phosphoribosylglycinamide formyltransferase-1